MGITQTLVKALSFCQEVKGNKCKKSHALNENVNTCNCPNYDITFLNRKKI